MTKVANFYFQLICDSGIKIIS